ncbi:MAG: glycosyltransferase [Ruminiclostridium sp.]
MISVVIPIYNVRDYLDRCIESVVNQTFQDLEIILINDGSTDGSDEKCLEWAKKDERIIYVSKKNEGLGPTRNLGIKRAKYDYIAFVDSDDWWDYTMLEKMYAKVEQENADMVICDRYDVFINQDNGEMELKLIKLPIMFEGVLNRDIMNRKRIIHIVGNSAWGRLYKKGLFIENNIYMPNVYCEDAAIMSYLTTFCKKISCVKEPLYFYLQKRPGSILNTMKAASTMCNCLEFVRKKFAESGKLEEYYEPVKWLAYEFTIGTLRTTNRLLDQENVELREKIRKDLYAFLEKNYKDQCNDRYILGSYNLRRSVGFGIPMIEEKRKHYGFSSIISMFSSPIEIELKHNDGLRQKWINEDMTKDFYNSFAFKDGDCLCIDFLEERYDIAKCGDTYFTLSEAFEEIEDSFPLQYERLNRMSDEVTKLWEAKCDAFIAFLKNKTGFRKVVLVKMYLTPWYGEYRKEKRYENEDQIAQMNKLFAYYYDYFIKKVESVMVIEWNDSDKAFTDNSFVFGVKPWHLNEGYYIELGDKILEQLREA